MSDLEPLRSRRPRAARALIALWLSAGGFLVGAQPTAPGPAGEGPASAEASRPELRLQAAYYAEVALGDAGDAARRYEEILELPATSSQVAAQAHLRLGICRLLLGEEEAAREQFRIVVEGYGREKEAAEIARRYLGIAERPDLARFMPPSVTAYVELLGADEQLAHLATALRGTPLENPVDDALDYLTDREEGRAPDPGATGAAPWVRYAAAVLNRGFLNELRKTDGLAFAVPSGSRFTESYLAVFLPGRSDVLRGIGSFLGSTARPQSRLESFLLYRLESGDGSDWLALSDEAIVWGRPRAMVTGAVGRYRSRAESLATREAFRQARADAGSSLVTVYLGDDWIRALGTTLDPPTRSAFESAATFLGWKDLHPITLSVRAEPREDALRLELRAWSAAAPAASIAEWLSPPTLGARELSAIPEPSLGYFAARTDGARQRLQLLVDRLTLVVDDLPGSARAALSGSLTSIREVVLSGAGRDLVDATRSAVIGVLETRASSLPRSGYVILELRDGAEGERALRSALSDGLHRLLRNRASRRFLLSDVGTGPDRWTWHHVRPLPSVEIGYAKVGDRVVIASSVDTAARVVAAVRRGSPPDGSLPVDASKLLVIRPARILDTLGRRSLSRPASRVLSAVDEITVHAIEERSKLSLVVRVPSLTRVLRQGLNRLARPDGDTRDEPSPRTSRPAEEGR